MSLLTQSSGKSVGPSFPPVKTGLRPSVSQSDYEDKGGDACLLSLFSRVRLCDPTDCSPPGSSVHGILQARILEWVAMPFFRGSSPSRDRTLFSSVSCIAPGNSLPAEPPGKPLSGGEGGTCPKTDLFSFHKQGLNLSPFPRGGKRHIRLRPCWGVSIALILGSRLGGRQVDIKNNSSLHGSLIFPSTDFFRFKVAEH